MSEKEEPFPLVCPGCRQHFSWDRLPLLYPCGHSVCQACTQQDLKTKYWVAYCPIDKEQNVFSDLLDFPVNMGFVASQLDVPLNEKGCLFEKCPEHNLEYVVLDKFGDLYCSKCPNGIGKGNVVRMIHMIQDYLETARPQHMNSIARLYFRMHLMDGLEKTVAANMENARQEVKRICSLPEVQKRYTSQELSSLSVALENRGKEVYAELDRRRRLITRLHDSLLLATRMAYEALIDSRKRRTSENPYPELAQLPSEPPAAILRASDARIGMNVARGVMFTWKDDYVVFKKELEDAGGSIEDQACDYMSESIPTSSSTSTSTSLASSSTSNPPFLDDTFSEPSRDATHASLDHPIPVSISTSACTSTSSSTSGADDLVVDGVTPLSPPLLPPRNRLFRIEEGSQYDWTPQLADARERRSKNNMSSTRSNGDSGSENGEGDSEERKVPFAPNPEILEAIRNDQGETHLPVHDPCSPDLLATDAALSLPTFSSSSSSSSSSSTLSSPSSSSSTTSSSSASSSSAPARKRSPYDIPSCYFGTRKFGSALSPVAFMLLLFKSIRSHVTLMVYVNKEIGASCSFSPFLHKYRMSAQEAVSFYSISYFQKRLFAKFGLFSSPGLQQKASQSMRNDRPQQLERYWLCIVAAYARAGCTYALTSVGYNFDRGLSMPANERLACTLFKIAADAGNLIAITNYANAMDHAGKHDVSLPMYLRSSNMGYSAAMSSVGLCYEKGSGAARSTQLALRWYVSGSFHGDPYSMTNYAYLREDGAGWIGVKPAYDEAVRLYKKAAAQNHGRAMTNLANMRYLPYYKSLPPDTVTEEYAFVLLTRAVALDSPRARELLLQIMEEKKRLPTLGPAPHSRAEEVEIEEVEVGEDEDGYDEDEDYADDDVEEELF